jgi:hypothetical protein
MVQVRHTGEPTAAAAAAFSCTALAEELLKYSSGAWLCVDRCCRSGTQVRHLALPAAAAAAAAGQLWQKSCCCIAVRASLCGLLFTWQCVGARNAPGSNLLAGNQVNRHGASLLACINTASILETCCAEQCSLLLLAAMQVSEGSGKILVTAVGDSSEWGKTISLVTSSGDEQTPLQVRRKQRRQHTV